MKSFLAFAANVVLGLTPAPRCQLCLYKARGPRHLARHMHTHGLVIADV